MGIPIGITEILVWRTPVIFRCGRRCNLLSHLLVMRWSAMSQAQSQFFDL